MLARSFLKEATQTSTVLVNHLKACVWGKKPGVYLKKLNNLPSFLA